MIPQVIEGPVLHQRHVAANIVLVLRQHACHPQQVPSHLHVGLLDAAADVVHLPRGALVQDDVKGAGHVRHVQVVARVRAVPMQGQRAATHDLVH